MTVPMMPSSGQARPRHLRHQLTSRKYLFMVLNNYAMSFHHSTASGRNTPKGIAMQETTIDLSALNPIYLEMGAAVQDCQRIELYISFIVTLLIDLSDGDLTEDQFRGSMETLGAQTMGRLMEEIKQKVGFTDESVRELRKALKARNFLIHRFYNERSDLLLTNEGRDRALREIRTKRAALNTANAMLDPVMKDLIRLKGIDMDQFRSELEQRFEA